jgi:Glycyl-tRNA synthetase alpha subunit
MIPPSAAYDLSLKCSHLFNILDAQGAISVTERVGVFALKVFTMTRSVSLLCVWFGSVTTPYREPSVGESVSLFREPDAGNLGSMSGNRKQNQV